ncbi:MAG: hypothetical protein IJ501_02280 [Bacilli bacterium]|nr:hypothetical protein [Bacilli bacterium]
MKKLILLTIILLLTGCSSYIELNDLVVINSIGIEQKDNKYTFYTSIVEEVDEETMKPKTKVLEVEGNSLNEIIDNLSNSLSKKIYISHLDLLLINDSIKSNELKEIINFFLNNNESREDFLVASSKDIKKTLEETKFKEINDLIEINQQETSQAIYTTMYDLIDNYYNNKPIYLTNLIYDEKLSINGLKVLKNNTYKEIENDKTIFINYLLNKVDTFKYSYNCRNNQYLYLNILRSNTYEFNKELIITNEIKIIRNDCNLNKDEIIKTFDIYLKDNLKKLTDKKLTIKNTIRGIYENN